MRFNAKVFILLVTLTSVSLTGCHPSSQSATTEKSATTTSAPDSTSPVARDVTVSSATTLTQINNPDTVKNNVKETDTAQALLSVLSGLMYKSLNNNPNQKLANEQKNCLTHADQHELVPIFQNYLQRKLTAEELTKTNQYYALPVGQKQIQLANQQLRATKGQPIRDPVILTNDEKLQIQAFQTTPEGEKLKDLLNSTNQAELENILIKPMMAQAVADCGVIVPNVAPLSATKP